ncbi:cell division protein ZipA [Paraglaciecola sp. 2405UD69-4]|uniref:cell division protein ZipA n=1 Tax=Paraglaciecola sp. 2405UD69-4 TaxID=3391836 RepID=UPI0039C9B137
MEDVLRWSLLVVGSCVIIGVAVHGIWVSRKNSEQKTTKKRAKPILQSDDLYEENELSDDSEVVTDINENIVEPPLAEQDDALSKDDLGTDKFDDLGIGSVRVVSTTADTDPKAPTGPETTEVEAAKEAKVTQESNAKSGRIYASVVTQPKPEYVKKSHVSMNQSSELSQPKIVEPSTTSNSTRGTSQAFGQVSTSSVTDGYEAPEPPPFLLKKGSSQQAPIVQGLQETKNAAEHQAELTTTSQQEQVEEKPSLSEQARNLVKRKKAETSRKRREPKLAEDQLRIDFDEEVTEQVEPSAPKEAKAQQTQSVQAQEVLVLNVKTPDGDPISGAALLPMLLTLGFKFGDQDIFHRHVNSNGKGPVLFSLANMFKPGVFDIDNLENFSTQGVSLFMILPIEGEPHQVFNMMHNAARKIAEEFSAQIYDAKRTLLTKQSLQQYVEKIREFERQRMLQNG